jgi:hypothetical protein
LAACGLLYIIVLIASSFQGYLPLLTREEHIVHFFRDVLALYPITKNVLSRRTTEYHWGEA